MSLEAASASVQAAAVRLRSLVPLVELASRKRRRHRINSIGCSMDVTVELVGQEPSTWSLVDLLGRAMGEVIEIRPTQFTIFPAGLAIGTMQGLRCGPFSSLDLALGEIERHTRGVCRRKPGDDGA